MKICSEFRFEKQIEDQKIKIDIVILIECKIVVLSVKSGVGKSRGVELVKKTNIINYNNSGKLYSSHILESRTTKIFNKIYPAYSAYGFKKIGGYVL
jgi:hypothetical protein